MKSYAKKIMTRLAAGAMALLLAVGTAATDMSVYAAETKTQEGTTEKKKITGFADLSDNPKEIRMTGKISLNRLLAKMPQSIDVLSGWRQRDNEYSGNLELCRRL